MFAADRSPWGVLAGLATPAILMLMEVLARA